MFKIRLPAVDREILIVLGLTAGLIILLLVNLSALIPQVVSAYLPEPATENGELIDIRMINEALKHIQ